MAHLKYKKNDNCAHLNVHNTRFYSFIFVKIISCCALKEIKINEKQEEGAGPLKIFLELSSLSNNIWATFERIFAAKNFKKSPTFVTLNGGKTIPNGCGGT